MVRRSQRLLNKPPVGPLTPSGPLKPPYSNSFLTAISLLGLKASIFFFRYPQIKACVKMTRQLKLIQGIYGTKYDLATNW